ncbi:Rz1-like lysis system protein LysC [Limnoglobus roseus]|uniref:Uncharacterized protein n=1 Tax=Limnoglobus roseus TaxID=2598579 RepID=A0A5C1ABR9_9BACT|nr:hypothetical protein [Limnoglobus roseus]QEL16701.1 hypothetical protein PX52LOC_03664 [Limnoglobus roseus]
MKRRFLIAALLLAGCQPSAKPSLAILPPADLVARCERLPDLKGDSLQAVYDYALATTFAYHRCEAKHAALAKWSREVNQ